MSKMMNSNNKFHVAVLIPCYNEQATIGKVIDDFRHELPEAEIFVYDNNSTDETAKIAQEHGAIVKFEPRQGKSNVIRQMFKDIVADVYVLTDGDGQCPPESVHLLMAPVLEGRADLVISDRISNHSYNRENQRPLHSFGNNLVRFLINAIYRTNITDAMSGYRVASRSFAKGFPILSQGFEIEVEMLMHAIDKNWRVTEIPIQTRSRPENSISKLSTFKDGLRVLACILSLFKDYRPLTLFLLIGLVLLALGIASGISVVINFLQTGLVGLLPTALLAVGLVISGLLSLVCGLILDTLAKGFRKQYEIEMLKQNQIVLINNECIYSDNSNSSNF